MIGDKEFLDLAKCRVERDLQDPNNSAQKEAVTYAGNPVLQIVAGPGSGKTTVIVLRALRHVFVEGVRPENVLITTFTRKAAKELRTRWLDWGTAIFEEIGLGRDSEIDLNQCMIDTLDSVVQQVLTDQRPSGTLSPVVADTTVSNLILRRKVFQNMYDQNEDKLKGLLGRYTFDKKFPRNRGEALRTAKTLLDRFVQDRVELNSYRQSGQPEELISNMREIYRQQADATNVFDFALLEEKFLQELVNGDLNEWLSSLRAVLIDEYQDTNPLQEAIYFTMFKNVNLSATIVGDDDQSMYRFRGGSVELFTDFSRRCSVVTGRQTERVDMVRNFRSTPEIVEFYNNHITTDTEFNSARITPPKPSVKAVKPSNGIPVLGMFRPDEETLANHLASFLDDLIGQRGVLLGNTGREISLSGNGDLGDLVFLAHSVKEITYSRFNGQIQNQFPGLLRDELDSRGLRVFNPRGQLLRTISNVEILLGLVLLAIDFDDTEIDDNRFTDEAKHFLKRWRNKAQTFAGANPAPNDGRGINGFIKEWQGVSSGEKRKDFPRDWPALELVYKLLTWMPEFQRDPEHQVWLEAITRIISGASMISPYGMQILQNTDQVSNGEHVRLSRLSLVRDALVPIAEDQVDVDEDLIPSVPRNRLQFMTIHQAKGLEFPLVIVNVGARFKSNHWTQRFLRFPDKISNVVQAEDDVETHLSTSLRSGRRPIDRTFDDLVRLYYVAYSRPQSVLMLVGNESCLKYGKGKNLAQSVIPNIALGWHRDMNWPWRQSYRGRRPPVKVDPPFVEI